MNKLWIRTQNQLALININNVGIINNKIYANIENKVTKYKEEKRVQQTMQLLGVYQDAEEAMKVLYEIERSLISPSTIVFQMPAINDTRSNYGKK